MNFFINIDPIFWGAEVRHTMYAIALSYDPSSLEKRKAALSFFESLGILLPCEECKKEYITHLEKKPLKNVLDSRTSLLNWLYEMHLETNTRLGKSMPQLEEIVKRFEKHKNKEIKEQLEYPVIHTLQIEKNNKNNIQNIQNIQNKPIVVGCSCLR